MKFGLFLVLALVFCTAVALASAQPAWVVRDTPESSVSESPEEPASENPEVPYVPENPEEPSSSNPEEPPSNPSNPEEPSSASNSNDEASSSEVLICSMMVLECPDGSFATQNSKCEYICGAPPTGGLSWSSVNSIRMDFERAYGSSIWNSAVSDLHNKGVVVRPPEKLTDYCIEAYIYESDVTTYPAVYNGVRVFYFKTTPCSPVLCPDGSYVSCNMVCLSSSSSYSDSNSLFMPFTLVLGVVLMSACCCCIRRRRCKAQQCKQVHSAANAVTPIPSTSHDMYYPADHYELLQQQLLQEAYAAQSEEAGMPPHMMMGQPMMFPPMPPVPPQMMQNGTYPVMIQGPNGVWYMAPPHPEDA